MIKAGDDEGKTEDRAAAALRQSEQAGERIKAVIRESDQIMRSSIELVQKVRNSHKFLGHRDH